MSKTTKMEFIVSADIVKTIIEAGGYVKDWHIEGIHQTFTGKMELRLSDKFTMLNAIEHQTKFNEEDIDDEIYGT